MALTKERRLPRALDHPMLEELALRYVGKYATTRAKLRSYLLRKVKERGWVGERQPDFEVLANRLADLGYIDDAAYAMSKSQSLSARGYGKRRLSERLRLDGVGLADAEAAHAQADDQAVEAALRFAERRQVGPFSPAEGDKRQREKWIAAMVRAGHCFALARAIAALTPGAEIDCEALLEHAGTTKT